MIPFWKVRRFCSGGCTAVYRYTYVCIALEQPIDITPSHHHHYYLLGGTVVTLTRTTSQLLESKRKNKEYSKSTHFYDSSSFFPSILSLFFFCLSFRGLFHHTERTLIRSDESIGAKKNKKKKEMSWENSLHTVISIVYTDASWFM